MSDRIEAEILDVLGEEVAAAVDTPLVVIEGPKGDPGAPGKDGHSPVVTATKSGKITTISVDGAAIATVEDGADGAPGKDGADGSNGKDGEDGAPGSRGADGITPTIGSNGNWYLGEEDTGKPSRGEKGEKGDPGKDGVNGETGPAGPRGEKGADGSNGKDGAPGEKGADGAPGIYYGTTQPTGDTHPVWIDQDGGPDDGGLLPAVTAADNGKVLRVVNGAWSAEDVPTGGTDMGITGAAVGQIAKITAVDDTGKPTAWSPVDMPSGGGGETWELINEVTLSEDAMSVVFDKDKSGAAFALRKFAVFGKTKGSNASNTGGGDICINVANNYDDKYSIVPPIKGHGALKGDQLRYWHAAAESFAEKGWRWYITGADNTWQTSHINICTSLIKQSPTIQKVATYLALWSRTSGSAFAAGSKIELYGVRA